jgi:hypothetical protein
MLVADAISPSKELDNFILCSNKCKLASPEEIAKAVAKRIIRE